MTLKVVSKGSPLQRGCAETKPVIPRRKAKKEAKPEANVMDVECSVDYADDQALMHETKAWLQETTYVRKFCEYSGLYINVAKTKSMAVIGVAASNPSRKHFL